MWRYLLLERVTQTVAMTLFPSIMQADLFFRVLDFFYNRLVREDLELTRVFIDLDFNVAGVVVGLVGLFQSIRQCLDDDFFFDALFLFQDVHGIKQFLCLLLLLSAHFAAPLLKLDCQTCLGNFFTIQRNRFVSRLIQIIQRQAVRRQIRHRALIDLASVHRLIQRDVNIVVQCSLIVAFFFQGPFRTR